MYYIILRPKLQVVLPISHVLRNVINFFFGKEMFNKSVLNKSYEKDKLKN